MPLLEKVLLPALVNEPPLLTGAGIKGHRKKNWYKLKRFSCYGWTSVEPPGASWEMGTKTQATPEKALEETATATRYESRVSAKGQEEALISLYKRIISFLFFHLFFPGKYVHGCCRSHASKWLAPPHMCSFSSSYQAVFKKKGSKLSYRIIHWIPVNQPNIGHKLPSQENELILKSVRNDNSEAFQFGLKKNNRHHFLNDIWGVRTLRVPTVPLPPRFALWLLPSHWTSVLLCLYLS